MEDKDGGSPRGRDRNTMMVFVTRIDAARSFDSVQFDRNLGLDVAVIPHVIFD